MKQKIKIMKQAPQPSDEEIRSYMNFDNLLASRKVATHTNKIHAILKWTFPVAIITGIVVWFLMDTNKNVPFDSKENINFTDTAKSTTVLSPAPDSSTHENATEKAPDVKLPVDQHPKASQAPGNAKTSTKDEVYIQAEPMNGYTELYAYFNTNLLYPSEALKDSIQGVQTISFIISVDGKPQQIDVFKSLGEPFEKEAKRLIENMPAWKPATLNGKPVPSKITLPLTFQIQKFKN